jgi:hypothetical protein
LTCFGDTSGANTSSAGETPKPLYGSTKTLTGAAAVDP